MTDPAHPQQDFTFSAPEPERPVEPGPVPAFSVLIAAYQAADVIGDAIESALAQTLPPHEVIVCDDGSTDDLDGALANYLDRIVLVRQENRGAAAARNRAAREATGDFVAVLDADDVYLPRRLEALGALAAARPDLDLVTTNEYIEANGRTAGLFYTDERPFVTEAQEVRILEYAFLWHPAVRRSRFVEHGGFDESLSCAEDWDLWIRLLLDGSRAGAVDEPLMRYRLRIGSLTSNPVGVLQGRARALEKALARRDLAPPQRDAAGRSRALWNAELKLAEAREAVRASASDARARALAIARNPGYRVTSRLKAALSAVSPGAARMLLERREAAGVVTVHGPRLRRGPAG